MLFPISALALPVDDTSYILNIPRALSVSGSGWAASDGLGAKNEGQTFTAGRKLVVEAESANGFNLVNQDDDSQMIAYEMASDADTTADAWAFFADELNRDGGSTKDMGIIVGDCTGVDSGTYRDRVTFTASVVEDVTKLSELNGDYVAHNGETLTGALGGNYKISIADGAAVTLNGVTINGVTDDSASYPWAGITCEGDAIIILEGENVVKGFYSAYPGIQVPVNKTLIIRGGGSLDASSNGLGAGIGGGDENDCGNITIEGGMITATGGYAAAGIGAGSKGSCGSITITADVKRVKATHGGNAPYSIGNGTAGGSTGTVTIGGVETGPISKSPYIYPEPRNLANLTGNYEAHSGETLTGELGGKYKISIANGATVFLRDVKINGISDNNCTWAGINCSGDATLILEGENVVKGFCEDYPGVHVPVGKTLFIKGDGSLEASSNGFGAGIGGGYDVSCGNIVIEGGKITATGGCYAAGIGGGDGSSCGYITITTGVTSVTATMGDNTYWSIGPGATSSWCGDVTIGGEQGTINISPYTYTPSHH